MTCDPSAGKPSSVGSRIAVECSECRVAASSQHHHAAVKVARHRGWRQFGLFVVVTFATSWSAWVIAVLWPDSGAGQLALPVGTFGPFMGALVVISHSHGRHGVARALRRHVRFRDATIAIALAVLIPVVLLLAGRGLHLLTGGDEVKGAGWGAEVLPLVMLYVLVLGGPLGEELGWRGFALPWLEARWHPVVATLALWAVWAAWHVPLFLVEGSAQAAVPPWLWLLQILVLSFLFTWLQHLAPHTLVPALVLHTAFNVGAGVLLIDPEAGASVRAILVALLLGAALVAALATTRTFREGRAELASADAAG